ncbi:uncharacterized protein LOC100835558 isoform X1 [Brachypodium distachyon]|uniref:DUF7906 domain-containing protein n=3 Tax=Brachypodium distachyon TaxID=15368 RepID=I1I9M1_BRADI|nr:uncharacterized protein LOC100835558 isoform X1 [Brachypodium distachyon]KQJ99438.1 hypothetical protein BRADI_3g43260v3 [Brachypodium distachyon]|eukprot:XP_010235422.1 uncharacterized protein LOC100835558 isoform X1 [Brachypodium distachyon]
MNPFLFFLVLLLLALVPSQEAAEPTTPGTRTRKIGRTAASSVFSLFNLKPQSKFWTESIMRTEFDDLKGSTSRDSSNKALLNFTRAGNVANYMSLAEVDSIYLSIPVNFIFIGFDGKGGHEFKLAPEELERWFSKIDHIFEHTRIPPVGEVLTPFYKTSVKKLKQYDLPLVSHVNHNFSVHAIHMGEDVMSVFEHAIKVLSRREDLTDLRENEAAFWQVDSDQMEHIFSTLVDHLQIQEAYNIFIINPKPIEKSNHYGYRKGFSESEINLLRENKTLQAQILQSKSDKKLYLDIEKGVNKRPLYESHPLSSFSWTTTDNVDMGDWSKTCKEALSNFELLKAGKSKDDIVYDKAVQILHGAKDELHDVLVSALMSSDLKGLHAECLTDIWIGRDRFAFVDLSAGPFSWGPAVGGDGVRTELSLPNIAKTVGAVAEVTEEEAEERLQDTIRERFSSVGEDYHAVDILLAEIDVYELFAFKHCMGRRVELALCKELEERMHDLKNELEGYNNGDSDEINKKKALDALKRVEKWNLFKDTSEEHHNYTVARDSFLAHLGSTLWGSMRHVIAPSVSHSAYHYYEKLSFQLYFVTQEKVRNINQLPVNVKSIKEGLSSLLLRSQKSMFSQHMLSLSEEPALMMAFSMARRAAAVPLLLVNGTYRSTVRTYLDSAILQHQLQRLSERGSLKGEHSNHRSTLEVPVFWFIHSEPLLLDKHYQAKALSNMVVVVQSDANSWESHLQCNGRSILWDLRKPVKAAIAASAEYVAGLLPSHLVYSSAHETAFEDWTWSVGCNPLSINSKGWRLSEFQQDVIARNYIITAVEESIQVVNSAIQRLITERTTEQGFKIFKTQEGVMVEKYNSVVNLWRRVAVMSKGLRYGDAVKLMSLLEDASNGFSRAVNSTISSLHPVQCARERKLDVQLDLTTLPAFIAVFGLLWFLLRPRRPKPKIN